MSYILTKKGKIYETDTTNDSEDFIGIKSVVEDCFSTLIGIGKDNVIRQGKDLKDLCDVFVLKGIDIIYFNKEHSQYRFEGSNEWFDITDTELRTGIYGAVWTNWGLRYITKMNSNKELEVYESRD